MSEDALELGCKISLISKAGIRYEGRLFTVDPDQCTIALSGVRSFGTEDRDVPQKVPPQNNVYDYILFRGTDIRDIVVLNNAPTYPNDPAIMQLTLQPKPYGTPGVYGAAGMLGAPSTHLGQFPSATGAYGAGLMMGGGMAGTASGIRAAAEQATRGFPKPSELTMPVGEIPVVVPADHHNQQHLSPAAVIGVGDTTTPQVTDGHDLSASVLDNMFGGRSRSTTPASLLSGKSSTAEQGIQVSGASSYNNKRDDKKMVHPIQPPGQQQQRGGHYQQRERRDSRGEHIQNQQRNQQNRNRYPNHQQQQQQQYHQNNQRQQQQQGGWIQRGQQRQRGGRGRNTGYKNPNAPQTDASGKPKIKFDQEYDFEQANSEFENLKSQLAKVKLDDAKPEVNGDTDKKDDSGNETGAGEGEQEEEQEVYYDKAKSFFDNISCEAVERSKGRSQRTDWRTERKLNSETFGVAATRRGNYRGRGPYRPMGGGGGGYRGPNNYRRGYQNQRNNQQQFQNNAQSSTSGVNNKQQQQPFTQSQQQQQQPIAVNSAAKN